MGLDLAYPMGHRSESFSLEGFSPGRLSLRSFSLESFNLKIVVGYSLEPKLEPILVNIY